MTVDTTYRRVDKGESADTSNTDVDIVKSADTNNKGVDIVNSADITNKMVLLQYSGTHFPNVMGNLRSFKKDGSLCDVYISVGDKRIPVHKCILAAGSDYFKSLFCGPLKQDLSEVNLSTVTDDYESVVSIIDFLYTGNINVDEENLGTILKLASFLLIGMVREMCIRYMESSLDLDSYLQYYLLAAEFMVPELEQTLLETIASRFHDCLILRDSSLNVSPSELKLLMDSCKIFEYCSDVDVMSFMIDWVAEGNTKEHEVVACQVLELAKQKKDRPEYAIDLKQQFCTLKEKLQIKLEPSNECQQFVTKINDIIREVLTTAKNLGLNERMESQKPFDREVRGSDAENVLIAFVPNKRLIFFVEGNVPSQSQYVIRNGEALFDICLYITRKKTWYQLTEGLREKAYDHLTEGLRENAFKKMSNREAYDTCVGMDSCLMGSSISFISQDDCLLFIYDLRNFTWKEIGYHELVAESEGVLFYLEDQYFVCSDDQVYIFLHSWSTETNQDTFHCYTLSSDDSWRHLVSMANMEDEENTNFYGNKFSVAISKTSNEMIIVYGIEKLNIFIIGIDTETPQTTMRSFEVDNIRIKGLSPYSILEDGEYFAIVEEARNTENQRTFQCVCRYNRQTNELITDSDTEVKFDRFYQMSYIREHLSNPPCEYLLDTNDNRHIWTFEGNARDGSSLKSVSFEGEDGLAVQKHTPPPFSCVSGMVAGDIKRECLTNLEPITNYLHEDVEGDIPSEGEYSPSD